MNFHYVAVPMMTSQILKSVDLKKTPQKSRYLKNETSFFSSEKNHEIRIKGYFMVENSFVAFKLGNL